MKKVEDFEGNHKELSLYIVTLIFKSILAIILSLLMLLLCLVSTEQETRRSVVSPPGRAVNITRKEKEYQGMLEYKQGDESRLLKNLVIGGTNICSRK